MFNSAEVIQWESGKSINSIAAAQGIRIRRRCRPRYPSEGSGADKAVPRNMLEQIIWDKEVEVSQVNSSAPRVNCLNKFAHKNNHLLLIGMHFRLLCSCAEEGEEAAAEGDQVEPACAAG